MAWSKRHTKRVSEKVRVRIDLGVRYVLIAASIADGSYFNNGLPVLGKSKVMATRFRYHADRYIGKGISLIGEERARLVLKRRPCLFLT